MKENEKDKKQAANKAEAWYEGVETGSERSTRLHLEGFEKIKSAIEQGMTFEQAANSLEAETSSLRASIINEALKALIAEMHFGGKMPLAEVAKKLRLPLKRLDEAMKEMFEEVEDAAVDAFRQDMDSPKGNA